MSKTALVISGGGSKGAFAVGVLKAVFQHNPGLTFDMLIGTSTGALIAPLATPDSIALLEQLYTTVTTDNVIEKNNVGNRFLTADSIFGVGPLGKLIMQYYTDAFFKPCPQNPAMYCWPPPACRRQLPYTSARKRRQPLKVMMWYS